MTGKIGVDNPHTKQKKNKTFNIFQILTIKKKLSTDEIYRAHKILLITSERVHHKGKGRKENL